MDGATVLASVITATFLPSSPVDDECFREGGSVTGCVQAAFDDLFLWPPPPCQSSSCSATGAERRGVEKQQYEGHRGRSSSLVLSDLLMLDLVVAGLQGGEIPEWPKSFETLADEAAWAACALPWGWWTWCRVLRAGRRGPSGLRSDWPQNRGSWYWRVKEKKKPTFESDLLLARHVRFLVLYQGCDAKRVHREVPYVDLANGSH